MAEEAEKLEVMLKKKKEELEAALREFEERKTTKPITSIKSTEEKLKAVKEMEIELIKKKEPLEKALREVQEITARIGELKPKVVEKEEEVISEIKVLQEKLRTKKGELEKATKELEELKDRYTKKFYG